jgi:hypothetical protein
MRCGTETHAAFQKNLNKEPLVPSPLMGEGQGGGGETMARYKAVSPLPLTPFHQGGGIISVNFCKIFPDIILR